MKYILITAAKNEQAFIRATLKSVANQTQLPVRWVIIDDGSSDGTGAIVEEYRRQCPWIDLVPLPPRADRNFAAKAEAVNMALARVESLDFDIVGNLDADVSFPPDYMEFLLGRFGEDLGLGVAGTPFTQDGGYDSTRDSFEGDSYVAGPCQLFRYTCFNDIGGYQPNRAGGVDWIAVMTARMKGWRVQSFPEMRFHHHRPMGTAGRGEIVALFSYGQKDYYLGGSPVWEMFRVVYRAGKRPILVGSLALAAGYLTATLRRMERPVSKELMQFHRRDQMRKLRAILGRAMRLRRIDGFHLTGQEQRDTALTK